MNRLGVRAALLAMLTLSGCATYRGATPADSAEQSRIAELRDEWYSAYFRGDTATLDRIEADDFVVIDPSGQVETTEGRYAGIQERVKENQWFASGTTRGPEQVEFRSYGEVMLVYGSSLQDGSEQKVPPLRRSGSGVTDVGKLLTFTSILFNRATKREGA